MNTIDVVILIIVGFFAVKGLFRGIVIEFMTFIGMLAGYVLALKERTRVGAYFIRFLHLPDTAAETLAFILCMVLVFLIFRWIAQLIKAGLKDTLLKSADHAGGFFMGMLKGTVLVSVFVMLAGLLPMPQSFCRQCSTSILYEPVLAVAPALYRGIGQVFPYTRDFYKEWQQNSNIPVDAVKNKMIESHTDGLSDYLPQSASVDSLLKEMNDALPQPSK